MANPNKSIMTKVREDLVYNLEQIDGSDSYFYKVQDVFCNAKSLDKNSEFPSIYVEVESYNIVTENYYQIDFEMTVNLRVYLCKEDDPTLAREQIIQDIRTKLFESLPERNGFLPDSEGECHTRAVILKSINFEMSEESRIDTVIITIVLEFSERTEDATESLID